MAISLTVQDKVIRLVCIRIGGPHLCCKISPSSCRDINPKIKNPLLWTAGHCVHCKRYPMKKAMIK